MNQWEKWPKNRFIYADRNGFVHIYAIRLDVVRLFNIDLIDNSLQLLPNQCSSVESEYKNESIFFRKAEQIEHKVVTNIWAALK